MKIGNIEFPDPCRTAPKGNTKFFIPDVLFPENSGQYSYPWDAHRVDCVQALANGFVHLTKEAATLHALALCAINKAQFDKGD